MGKDLFAYYLRSVLVGPGPHPTSYAMEFGCAVSPAVKWPGRETYYFHLAPNLRMSRAVFLFVSMASWYARGQLKCAGNFSVKLF